MCIKILCYSTETYLRYNVKREKQTEIYMWALHHKLVLFQQSKNFFHYVPENDIEGDILGWTTSWVIPWFPDAHILDGLLESNKEVITPVFYDIIPELHTTGGLFLLHPLWPEVFHNIILPSCGKYNCNIFVHIIPETRYFYVEVFD